MASVSVSALKLLFDLAKEDVEQATRQLGVVNKALKEAKDKGEMLEKYKQDYIDHFNQQQQTGLSKEAHLNYQSFLHNLHEVIKGQADVIVSAQYECDKQRKVLQEAQSKKMSFEVLIKKAEKKAMVIANKQEQKLMDEFAMRHKQAHAH